MHKKTGCAGRFRLHIRVLRYRNRLLEGSGQVTVPHKVLAVPSGAVTRCDCAATSLRYRSAASFCCGSIKETDLGNTVKRVTVTLGAVDQERLEEISERERVSQNDAIRRALATEDFVSRTLAEGRKILVEDADGKVREVEFVK